MSARPCVSTDPTPMKDIPPDGGRQAHVLVKFAEFFWILLFSQQNKVIDWEAEREENVVISEESRN